MTEDKLELLVTRAQRSAARASTSTWLCMVFCILCLVASIKSCEAQQQTKDGLEQVAHILQRMAALLTEGRG